MSVPLTHENCEGGPVDVDDILAELENAARRPSQPGDWSAVGAAMAIRRLACMLDRDRYVVAAAIGLIERAIRGRTWLLEGRGPYEWDDDDYRKEFGAALEEVETMLEPLRKVAWDKSDCTRMEERVVTAKQLANALLAAPVGQDRQMIAADLGLPCRCTALPDG